MPVSRDKSHLKIDAACWFSRESAGCGRVGIAFEARFGAS